MPRTHPGVAGLRAAAAAHLSPAGQLQVATAVEVIDALEARLHLVRHQLLADAGRAATRALSPTSCITQCDAHAYGCVTQLGGRPRAPAHSQEPVGEPSSTDIRPHIAQLGARY